MQNELANKFPPMDVKDKKVNPLEQPLKPKVA